jgi:hypothetical protein
MNSTIENSLFSVNFRGTMTSKIIHVKSLEATIKDIEKCINSIVTNITVVTSEKKVARTMKNILVAIIPLIKAPYTFICYKPISVPPVDIIFNKYVRSIRIRLDTADGLKSIWQNMNTFESLEILSIEYEGSTPIDYCDLITAIRMLISHKYLRKLKITSTTKLNEHLINIENAFDKDIYKQKDLLSERRERLDTSNFTSITIPSKSLLDEIDLDIKFSGQNCNINANIEFNMLKKISIISTATINIKTHYLVDSYHLSVPFNFNCVCDDIDSRVSVDKKTVASLFETEMITDSCICDIEMEKSRIVFTADLTSKTKDIRFNKEQLQELSSKQAITCLCLMISIEEELTREEKENIFDDMKYCCANNMYIKLCIVNSNPIFNRSFYNFKE